MTQQQSETMDKAITSEGEKMPEIQALTLRAQDFSQSVDRWNTAMIWALVFAAFAAIAVVVTTHMALKRTKQLADVQDELIQAKDKQLIIDLKDKDLKIADAGQRAAAAGQKAEEFRLHIAEANQRAEEAKERATQARLELAKFRAPRMIAPDAQLQMSQTLAAFAGTPFDLSVGSDSESVDLMESVLSVLSAAKWKQVDAAGPIGVSGTNPLVGVSMVSGVHVEIREERRSEWEQAAKTLFTLIKREGIAVEVHAAEDITNTAMHVIIGTKPRD
jgi:hypothetical protein